MGAGGGRRQDVDPNPDLVRIAGRNETNSHHPSAAASLQRSLSLRVPFVPSHRPDRSDIIRDGSAINLLLTPVSITEQAGFPLGSLENRTKQFETICESNGAVSVTGD